MVKSEWLFVYHEPLPLPDKAALISGSELDEEAQERTILAASYAVAYEQYLAGNAVSARCRTWALRLILVSLLLQAVAFVILPFH
ncbi:hypothetical protein [Consotaella salsifontis]|uniref:Uncharacterized protein n=1 Tax=Consotaella salsifontis TaxID=1365950 RepID=A0A1T4TBF6_9HYPH|nr:hypothetical protein [Consotaella salsifontis]SKA37845.1 hypothetical protein SAMN05428963_12336 [Consotaella salsifontis]